MKVEAGGGKAEALRTELGAGLNPAPTSSRRWNFFPGLSGASDSPNKEGLRDMRTLSLSTAHRVTGL